MPNKRLCCIGKGKDCGRDNHACRPLDAREDKLDILLSNYTDAQETLYSGQGRDDSSDGGLLLMPMVWNMSYRELERSLKRMRALAETPGVSSPSLRACYVHLGEWYLRSVRKRVPLMRKDKKGRPYHVVTGMGPQYVLSVVRGGDPSFVMKGLEWVAQEFVGEVYLPQEFVATAA